MDTERVTSEDDGSDLPPEALVAASSKRMEQPLILVEKTEGELESPTDGLLACNEERTMEEGAANKLEPAAGTSKSEVVQSSVGSKPLARESSMRSFQEIGRASCRERE